MLTQMGAHLDAQTRLPPFVRDFAIELLGEELGDPRTQSTRVGAGPKANAVVGALSRFIQR